MSCMTMVMVIIGKVMVISGNVMISKMFHVIARRHP